MSAVVLPDVLVGLLQHLVVLLFAQVVIPNRMSRMSRKILVMDLQINLAPMDARLIIQTAPANVKLAMRTTAATELLSVFRVMLHVQHIIRIVRLNAEDGAVILVIRNPEVRVYRSLRVADFVMEPYLTAEDETVVVRLALVMIAKVVTNAIVLGHITKNIYNKQKGSFKEPFCLLAIGLILDYEIISHFRLGCIGKNCKYFLSDFIFLL